MILRVFNDAVSAIDFIRDLIGLEDNTTSGNGTAFEHNACAEYERE
jgi:hypothetical protein